jgi:hypothetical protein
MHFWRTSNLSSLTDIGKPGTLPIANCRLPIWSLIFDFLFLNFEL